MRFDPMAERPSGETPEARLGAPGKPSGETPEARLGAPGKPSGETPEAHQKKRARVAVNAQEALSRAVQGQSLLNVPSIIEGFMQKGIPESEVKPRENVFTFAAWRALGRAVRKGEHGVKVLTWIPVDDKKDQNAAEEAGGEAPRAVHTRPWTSTVFHVSQTEPICERNGKPAGKDAATPTPAAVVAPAQTPVRPANTPSPSPESGGFGETGPTSPAAVASPAPAPVRTWRQRFAL